MCGVCVWKRRAQICLKLCGCRWLGFWRLCNAAPDGLVRRAGWLDLAGCLHWGGLCSLVVMMGGGWMYACVCAGCDGWAWCCVSERLAGQSYVVCACLWLRPPPARNGSDAGRLPRLWS